MSDISDHEIKVERVIHAKPELVFTAWTDVEHISQWWGPVGFTTTTHEAAIESGGTWRFTMHGPDGVDYLNIVVFDEITPPERITYHHEGEGDHDHIKFDTTVTFDPADGGTLVRLRMIFETKELRDQVVREQGAVEGGQQTLSRLAEMVESAVDREAVEEVIATWADSFCSRDLDTLMGLYADEFLMFDAIPPIRETEPGTVRAKLEGCLPYFPEKFGWEASEENVMVGGDLAVAHRLFKYTMDDPDHPASQSLLRHTIALRKLGGEWKIVHDHCSVPFDPMTGKAVITKVADES
ncbi:SRPBCC domain-containing protein [Calycomorphotria hydatis]|uniref:Uncharacterized protein n=1 Tax=Calycomorphotria hydatis TaxID=2528027 RepID=A0A517T6W8_9PLAN|nr:SRPBCC domain-containing protein [Calycomorphotria hydatis]QDT64107.1 hypothetical protein V22_13380 [Calycomorphotria hydatis]